MSSIAVLSMAIRSQRAYGLESWQAYCGAGVNSDLL
jgi:hypothetical protein